MIKNITEKRMQKRLLELDRAFNKFIEDDKGLEAMIVKVLIREYRFMFGHNGFTDPTDGLVKIIGEQVRARKKEKEGDKE